MNLRFILLAGCLLIAAASAMLVHAPGLRIAVVGVALIAAVLALRFTSGSGEVEVDGEIQVPVAVPVEVPVAVESPKKAKPPKKSFRESLPKRGSSSVQLRLDELQQQLEAQQLLTSELAKKLVHHDGLRRAMWETFDGRLSDLESTQNGELTALREARQRHQMNVVRIQQSVDAQARELTALSEVLGSPEDTPAASSNGSVVASSF
jgi:hypothetical protein